MKTMFVCLVASALGALALPLDEDPVTIILPESRQSLQVEERADINTIGITEQDLANFKRYAQYAGAAYCDPVPGKKVYCKGDICPAGNHDNATIYSVFHGIETDILGFVAVDIPAREIILSVRGSSSLTNWLTDVLWAREPTALCEGCWAHHGFLRAYSEIAPAATAAVASAAALFPGYRVTVTGHSLGGAVATLLAAAQGLRGAEADLYTYGSPRAGNAALAEYVSSGPGLEGGNVYRVTHDADAVARLPPLGRGFRHTSPEYWLEPGPGRRVEYPAAGVRVCGGYAGVDCAAGAPWWVVDVTSHLYYLVAISRCGEAESRLSWSFGGNEAVERGGPVNGTTATNASVHGLEAGTVNTLAMFAKLDQEYAAALSAEDAVSRGVF